MIKKLTKHGNSLALILDKAILELLKFNPEDPVEVSTDGKSLIVTPTEKFDREHLEKFLKRTKQKYGRTYQKLAD